MMANWTIYHNPRCRKSRETLEIMQEHGIEPNVVEYLKNVPSEKDLQDLLMKLNKKPEEILRKGEAIFKEKFKGMSFNDHEWVRIMTEEPKLIERPIVVRDNAAIIGRPPENVMALIEKE